MEEPCDLLMALGTRTSLKLEGDFSELQVVSTLGKICGAPHKKKKSLCYCKYLCLVENHHLRFLVINIMGVVAKFFLALNSC